MAQSTITPQNHLLKSMSQEDLALLLPHLQPIDLEQRFVFYDIGAPLDYVYFIEQGVASVVATMESGASIEVGMIGNEGLLSVAAIMGEEISQQFMVMQIPGSALKMRADLCKAAFEQSLGIRKIMLRFASSFLDFSSQSAACNRLHSVEQRLARWLLMSNDRFTSNIMPLTQDYLAMMLGVRRAGVTEAAGELQRSGLIQYNNGQITIADRQGLENTACECYALDRKRLDRLLK